MIHEYQFSIDSIDAANKATHTTYAETVSATVLRKVVVCLINCLRTVPSLQNCGSWATPPMVGGLR